MVRAAPHVVVWILLLAPMVRSMARGWRPLGDDATIAIGAWRALSLHPPLLGQLTSATGGSNASDPGPLEYWLLGPFVHLDPGQGVLIGSALLCALILSVTIEVLRRTSGTWAAVIFTFVVVDMAIVSPTPFVDPVWNNSFGFFWFAAFLGVAFTVGRGHLAYYRSSSSWAQSPWTPTCSSCRPSGSCWSRRRQWGGTSADRSVDGGWDGRPWWRWCAGPGRCTNSSSGPGRTCPCCCDPLRERRAGSSDCELSAGPWPWIRSGRHRAPWTSSPRSTTSTSETCCGSGGGVGAGGPVVAHGAVGSRPCLVCASCRSVVPSALSSSLPAPPPTTCWRSSG